MASRSDVIREARAEIGKTNPDPYWAEVGWENYPPEWRKYWCGAFAMAMLKRAGVLPSDAKWKVGVGFIYPYKLKLTSNPKPGDVAYRDQPYQHHMLVESYDLKTGELTTIAGNELNPKGGATIVRHAKISSEGLLFYSIDHLVTEDGGGIGKAAIVGALCLIGVGLTIAAIKRL